MCKRVNIFFLSRQIIPYLLAGLTKKIIFKLVHIYNIHSTNTKSPPKKTPLGLGRKQNCTNTNPYWKYEILQSLFHISLDMPHRQVSHMTNFPWQDSLFKNKLVYIGLLPRKNLSYFFIHASKKT